MLFSIVSPFYNVEQYAQKCIESILNQTEKDFECILVDDGSPDSVPSILDEYAQKDTRIKVIHKQNGGLVSARKAGVAVAQGEYIVPVDGDDWIDSRYLEKFKNVITAYNPDIIQCGFYSADNNQERVIPVNPISGKFGYTDCKQARKYIQNNIFSVAPSQWAKAFKRESYLKYQMAVDDRISMGEDGAVVFPLLCTVNSVFVLNESLYYYRCNPASMTGIKRISLDSVVLRLKHFEDNFPVDMYNRDSQISKYVWHSFMNASISQFRQRKYRDVCVEIKKYLSGPICKYLHTKPSRATKEELLSYYLFKFRCLFIVKIISML